MNVSNLRLLAACLESREKISDELADAVLPDLWAIIHAPEDSVDPSGQQLAESRCALVGHFVKHLDLSVADACVEVAEQLGLSGATVADHWKRHGKLVRARLGLSRKGKKQQFR